MREIETRERELQAAVAARDVATLDRLLGQEFTLTTGRPGNEVRGRAEYLEITASRYVIDEYRFDELEVIELGPAAAVVRSRYVQRGSMDGAVLAPEALALRFFGEDGDDCLLLVNLGRDLHLYPSPEPLLAPPGHRHWQTLWSSEHPRYGGAGDSPIETDDGWRIPGHAAAVLVPALG